MLQESETITYLENESAMVYLKSPMGPQTRFKVFGSPSTPGPGRWAFEYQDQDAERLWASIPTDADVVITHTPPKGHCDAATKDSRSGCPALLRRLAVVRPLLHVCGHIHEARGIDRVQWSPFRNNSLVESIEHWKDPGSGNKKLSLLDLTSKSGRPLGRPLGDSACATRQSESDSLRGGSGGQFGLPEIGVLQPDQHNLKSTSSLTEVALPESEASEWPEDSGVLEQRHHAVAPRAALQGDSGSQSRSLRYEETAVINAAFLGPRVNGRTTGTNKPIVVDIELPVWMEDGGVDVQ